MEDCYVYMYADPSQGLPFYVGMGVGSRYTHHLRRGKLPKSSRDTRTVYKVRKLIKAGIEPLVIIVRDNLSREQAITLEIALVAAIGRLDLGTGPLTNLTAGGEGATGLRQSVAAKLAVSTRQLGNTTRKGVKLSQETRNKMAAAKAYTSDESRARMSAAKAGMTWDKVVAKQRMASLVGKPQVKIECVHCGKECSPATVSRWHNENCKTKEKPNES